MTNENQEIIKEIKKLDVFIKEDKNEMSEIIFLISSIVNKHKNTKVIQKIKNISKARMYDLFADVFIIEYDNE